jgi:hypothetical protein
MDQTRRNGRASFAVDRLWIFQYADEVPGQLSHNTHPEEDCSYRDYQAPPTPSVSNPPRPGTFHHTPQVVRLGRISSLLYSLTRSWFALRADWRISFFQFLSEFGIGSLILVVSRVTGSGEVVCEGFVQKILVLEAGRAENGRTLDALVVRKMFCKGTRQLLGSRGLLRRYIQDLAMLEAWDQRET